MIRMRKIGAVVCAALLLAAAACTKPSDSSTSPTVEAVPYPTKTVKLMAPAATGGGWDTTARMMQKALKDGSLITESAEVENVPGAGGTIGLAQLVTKSRGDAHQLMVMGLVMVGGIITNKSAVTLADTTPIATLTAETEIIVVKADSKYGKLSDLVTAWKANPGSVKWGGGSAGGVDQILVGLMAKAVGVDPKSAKYVPYSGGGEVKAALLSGDLEVAVSSVSEFKDLIASGQLRALGVSSAAPIQVGGKTAPTLKEGGVDVELMNWRGVVAPPGISDGERVAITALIDRLHGSSAWQKTLTDQGWDDFYKSGADATAFYTAESVRIKTVLTDIGLA